MYGPTSGYRESEADRYKPSGTAKSTFMPFRPQSSNPLKRLESADWNLYVVDMVSDFKSLDIDILNELIGIASSECFLLT